MACRAPTRDGASDEVAKLRILVRGAGQIHQTITVVLERLVTL